MRVDAVKIASRYLGLKEKSGDVHERHIQAWHADAGLGDQPDETPWCGAFVRHVCWLLSLFVPEKPARARSWLGVGRPVSLGEACCGWDLVILSRGSYAPGPDVLDAPGHVGFFILAEGSGDGIYVLGGNQSDAVTVQRYPAARVLGVRRLYDDPYPVQEDPPCVPSSPP
jgi:uncharacterized protein (TIGR02594 family)